MQRVEAASSEAIGGNLVIVTLYKFEVRVWKGCIDFGQCVGDTNSSFHDKGGCKNLVCRDYVRGDTENPVYNDGYAVNGGGSVRGGVVGQCCKWCLVGVGYPPNQLYGTVHTVHWVGWSSSSWDSACASGVGIVPVLL